MWSRLVPTVVLVGADPQRQGLAGGLGWSGVCFCMILAYKR